MATYIKEHAIAYAVYFVDNKTIDEINILKATYRAMHGAVATVTQTHHIDMLLVDGNRFTAFNGVPHTCVVKGDNTYLSIAAASILAKVARDEYMMNLAPRSPYDVYSIDRNMGYGTPQHIRAIQEHGITDIHRVTFCSSLKRSSHT
jgi:ribonuclease HII